MPRQATVKHYSSNNYFGNLFFSVLIEMVKTRRHAYVPRAIVWILHAAFDTAVCQNFGFHFLEQIYSGHSWVVISDSRLRYTTTPRIRAHAWRQLEAFFYRILWKPINISKWSILLEQTSIVVNNCSYFQRTIFLCFVNSRWIMSLFGIE